LHPLPSLVVLTPKEIGWGFIIFVFHSPQEAAPTPFVSNNPKDQSPFVRAFFRDALEFAIQFLFFLLFSFRQPFLLLTIPLNIPASLPCWTFLFLW